MITKKIRLLSLTLAVIMVLVTVFSTAISVSAVTSQSGDVVYFDNSVTNYPQVYAYLWTNGAGSNANWPGELMTQVEGDIWGYTINGSYENIIFSQGDSSGQSTDLVYNGNGMLATPNDNGRFNVTWSEYKGNVTLPTIATQPTSETTTQATEATTESNTTGEYVVYCKNDKGWSKINAYLWNSDEDKFSGWPGVAMTDLGGGIFQLKYNKAYANIIFNNGSEQTGDLTIPANVNCYNNSTGSWEYYVPSPVTIESFTTSRTSPCYTTCDVVLSAKAQSTEGAVKYKFTVADANTETVLSDGSVDSVVWVPTVAGTYTLKLVVSDNAGNSKELTREFIVEDAVNLVKPFIKAFSNSLGTTKEIKQNTPVVFTMDAIGGKTGTNLLFYKFAITEPDSTKNIAYYTTSNTYSYTPEKLGSHIVKVSVQNSNNTTVTDTYTYECVENLTEEPTQYVKGDANGDGMFDIMDVSFLQLYLLKKIDLDVSQLDLYKDGEVNILDVSMMQLVLLKKAEFD